MKVAIAVSSALLLLPALAAGNGKPDPAAYAGWQVLRQFDCARCHGAGYEGSVGPSLVESARSRGKDDFARIVLEGTQRGMPPYKSVARVADNVGGIYAYLRGRADGSIKAGTLDKP